MPEVMSHRSSHIATSEYDQDSQDLTITFTDGRSYVYHSVPRGRYTQFISSPSTGQAFNALIRDSFDYEEV
jgi:hypothetical protein